MIVIFALIVAAGWWAGHWIIAVAIGAALYVFSPIVMLYPHWRREKSFAIRYWRREQSDMRGIQLGWVGYAWWYPAYLWG